MYEEYNLVIEAVIKVLGIIVLIFGVVGGLYSFYMWIHKLLFPPKIRLSFDRNKTFHKANEVTTHQTTYWIHCLAHNDSNSIIRNCKTFLNAVFTINSQGTMEKFKDFNAKLPLQWAHTLGRELIDLLPNEIGRIDLAFMIENNSKLFVCTSQIPAGTTKFVGNGTFVFQIITIADNAKSHTLYLRIKHNGNWKPIIDVENI